MAQKPLTIPALIVCLIFQAAAAQAAFTCAQDPKEGTTAGQEMQGSGTSGHDHHGMHDAVATTNAVATKGVVATTTDETASHAPMPCCDVDEVSGCSMSGCAGATQALTFAPLAQLFQHQSTEAVRPLDWLGPYPSPADGIFRPPIA